MSQSKLYVGDLKEDVTKEDLEKVFSPYGELRQVWVSHSPPGYAFVDFEDARDAEDASRALDKRIILGSRIRVEFSRGGRRRESSEDRLYSRQRLRRPFNPSDLCYECGQPGHYAYDCEIRIRRMRNTRGHYSPSPYQRHRRRSNSYRRDDISYKRYRSRSRTSRRRYRTPSDISSQSSSPRGDYHRRNDRRRRSYSSSSRRDSYSDRSSLSKRRSSSRKRSYSRSRSYSSERCDRNRKRSLSKRVSATPDRLLSHSSISSIENKQKHQSLDREVSAGTKKNKTDRSQDRMNTDRRKSLTPRSSISSDRSLRREDNKSNSRKRSTERYHRTKGSLNRSIERTVRDNKSGNRRRSNEKSIQRKKSSSPNFVEERYHKSRRSKSFDNKANCRSRSMSSGSDSIRNGAKFKSRDSDHSRSRDSSLHSTASTSSPAHHRRKRNSLNKCVNNRSFDESD